MEWRVKKKKRKHPKNIMNLLLWGPSTFKWANAFETTAEANRHDRPIALGGDTGGTLGHGWVVGWCSLFLSKLKLTALECDRESGNDWGRLDTAVTPSTILYKATTMTMGLKAVWLHVGGMHAYHTTQWACSVRRWMLWQIKGWSLKFESLVVHV